MGKTIGKIVYVIVAIFFIYVMIKGGAETSSGNLDYIKENIVVAEDGKVLPENEGKIVLLSGNVSVDEKSLKDEEFDVEVDDVIFLNRVAYQYRWYTYQDEERYKTYETNSEGRKVEVERTRTVTKLTKGWLIADGKEKENVKFNKEDHFNPDSKMTSLRQKATVHLGEFVLDEEKLSDTIYEKKIKYYNDMLDGYHEIMGEYTKGVDKSHRAYITTGTNIGDYKVEFCYVKTEDVGEITLVGKQVGNKIEEYVEGNINLFKVYNEKVSKEEFLSRMESEFSSAKLGILVVLVILIVVGIFVFNEEIGKIADKIKENKKKNAVKNV